MTNEQKRAVLELAGWTFRPGQGIFRWVAYNLDDTPVLSDDHLDNLIEHAYRWGIKNA